MSANNKLEYRQNLYKERIFPSSRGGVSDQRTDGVVEKPKAISQIFNIAYGERTSLNQLAQFLKDNLAKNDSAITNIVFKYRETREGDVPHSLASIEKGNTILGYKPEY